MAVTGLPQAAHLDGLESVKVPPHSIEAEQAVLGGLMLDNRAWDQVADRVSEHDFYRNEHRQIYRALADLAERNDPCDAVTVSEWLQRNGILDQAGGLAYLATLAKDTPSAANIRAYADIVRERAMLRQLITIGGEIADSAFRPDGRTAGQLVENAEQRVFEIAERGTRARQAFQPLKDLLTRAVERIDELFHSDTHITGVPTGFAKFDDMTSGLQKGDLVIVAGRPSMGKAQPLDSRVLTIAGWERMGDLQVGDCLASVDGADSEVVAVHPRGVRQVYRVTFADGRSAEACADHLWRVHYREWPAPRVLSTAELLQKLGAKRYRNRLWIDTFSGEFGSDEGLPVDPWLLGALIGDGSLLSAVGFTTADPEIVESVAAAVGSDLMVTKRTGYTYGIAQRGGCRRKGHVGVTPNSLKVALAELGIWGHRAEAKFIPSRYLTASRQSRASLLAGLIDTDGWVEAFGSLRFCTVSERLANDVIELARSLGATASFTTKSTRFTGADGNSKAGRTAYVCNIQHDAAQEFARLERKRARLVARRRQRRLNIVDIRPSRITDTQCITVSHPTGLYITDEYTVTHNSAFAVTIAEHAAIKQRIPTAIFSLEMPGEQIALRMISSLGRVNQAKIRNGRFADDDWPRISSAVTILSDAPLFIDDSGGLTPVELRARARRLKREHGLGLIVVDYLQLMQVPGTKENRATEISEISRGLKALAKELEVPVIALSQLNRSVEQRNDKRPVMSDLRESGAIEQDADLIAFIYREEVYDKDTRRKGIADIIISKQRNGPIGDVQLTFLGEYTRFENLVSEEAYGDYPPPPDY